MKIKYLIDTILTPKLTALSFVDRYASIVRTINFGQTDSGVIKRYPVACDVSAADCENTGLYQDLVPNDNKYSVVYWEMIAPMTNQGFTKTNDFYQKKFRGTARLVVWLNLAKLGIESCTASLELIPILEKEITTRGKISGGVFDGSLVWIEPRNMVKQDINTIFGGYDYDKLKNYYLYPFDFFAIDVQFTLEQCLSKGATFTLGTALDCPNEIAPVVSCKSLDFDGVNERLITAIEPVLNIEWSTPFSIEMWVKFDSDIPSFMTIFSTKYNNGIYIRRQKSTGLIQFLLYGNNGSVTLTGVYGNSVITIGDWHHLVFTSDGTGLESGLEIYHNDVQLTKSSIGTNNVNTGTMQNASTYLTLMNYTGQYTDGRLRNVRMWTNRVLSAGNVNALWHDGKYRMTEPHASDLILKLDMADAVWNGSEFDIADQTGLTAGAVSQNMEAEDLVEDCP